MWARPQKSKPDGAPMIPLAEYHIPTLAVCSSLFHHEEVIRTKPGFKQDSKIPIKNRAAARVEKFVADADAASVTPGLFELKPSLSLFSMYRTYPIE